MRLLRVLWDAVYRCYIPPQRQFKNFYQKIPFFDNGLHDAVDLDQQSGVARQNIPGDPVSNMANSYLKKEQTLPENETKYFVHANGMWSLDTAKILNDTVHPRSDTHSKNVTQNTTHHGNQSQQKIVSKGTVIKVSSTPSDYFCLCKLVRKGSWEVYFSYFSSSCLKLLGSCGNWEKVALDVSLGLLFHLAISLERE